METRKTKNQMMRELLEAERKRQLEGTVNIYSLADQSTFTGQSKAFNDLRPLFENTDAAEDDNLIAFPEWTS